MAVLLTVSETAAGSEVSDSLAGGGTGIDLGQVVNGAYTPIILQSANTGAQDVFIRHDATVDPITNVAFYISTYTGTYGGASSAASDYSLISSYGAADTGATKDNTDGNSRGLHIYQAWDASASNQFTYGTDVTNRKHCIFGNTVSATDGATQSTAFPLHVDACSYWNGSTEADASAPVTGKIGKSTDSALGNRAHFKMRFYLHEGATQGGITQWDYNILYSYSA